MKIRVTTTAHDRNVGQNISPSVVKMEYFGCILRRFLVYFLKGESNVFKVHVLGSILCNRVTDKKISQKTCDIFITGNGLSQIVAFLHFRFENPVYEYSKNVNIRLIKITWSASFLSFQLGSVGRLIFSFFLLIQLITAYQYTQYFYIS